MAAQNSFLLRTDSQNRVARFGVEGIGLELDAVAAEGFEGVAHHQVFCFGVDRGALPGARDPGAADFDALVGDVYIHESGCADDFRRRAFDVAKGMEVPCCCSASSRRM